MMMMVMMITMIMMMLISSIIVQSIYHKLLLMTNHYDGHDCCDDGGGGGADDGDDDVDGDGDDVFKLNYSTVEPRLIRTPHYYGQFALFLWKATYFLQIQPAQYDHALMWITDKYFFNSISVFPVLL